MILETNRLIERIKEGEGLHLDFKHCISDSSKIARSLVAYANTDGGSLLIGVRDNGSIAGVSSEEELYMIETAVLLHTKPVVEFTTINHEIEGKNVLEIVVEKSENAPHFAPDVRGEMKAFVRCDDKNVLAPRVLVQYWKLLKNCHRPANIVYDDIIELILKEIEFNGYVTKGFISHFTGMKGRDVEDVLVNLMLMKIIDIDINEKSVKFVFNEEYKNI